MLLSEYFKKYCTIAVPETAPIGQRLMMEHAFLLGASASLENIITAEIKTRDDVAELMSSMIDYINNRVEEIRSEFPYTKTKSAERFQ